MVTFNELLRVHGIDPAQVALLRHTGKKGPLGFTPHDLWLRKDGSFDLYQRTQAPDKARFELPYWASFTVNPHNETLFIGLYSATKGSRSDIDWSCPMTGLAPGADKGRLSDLYNLTPLDALEEHRDTLKIEWDRGRTWDRYAQRKEYFIVGDFDIRPFESFDASAEGEAIWRKQRAIERDPRLAKAALLKNSERHHGRYACEACDFRHSDRALFDAHHQHPLQAGPRMTKVSDLIVLCPICHRRAHRSANRMLPFGLAELQAWNGAGRP